MSVSVCTYGVLCSLEELTHHGQEDGLEGSLSYKKKVARLVVKSHTRYKPPRGFRIIFSTKLVNDQTGYKQCLVGTVCSHSF